MNTGKYMARRLDGVANTFHGTSLPSGASAPWKDATVGTTYIYRGTGITITYVKVKDENDSSDWVGRGCLYQTCALADFTDGGAAVGTLTLTADIPVGARYDYTDIRNVTGFAGDTSAALTVGDGTDVDRYNTSTLDVFSDAAIVAAGAASGTLDHAAAVSPVLTITTAADWGSVSAGALTVLMHFDVVA